MSARYAVASRTSTVGFPDNAFLLFLSYYDALTGRAVYSFDFWAGISEVSKAKPTDLSKQ